MDGIAHPTLFCDDGFHPAPALYARVAERLAEAVETVIGHVHRPQPQLETP
jgi:lysophospholipase L1-like esterase